MPIQDLNSPSELPLVSPIFEDARLPNGSSNNVDDDKVKMKKQLGLLEGVAIILGIIFGSGMLSFLFYTEFFILIGLCIRNIYIT